MRDGGAQVRTRRRVAVGALAAVAAAGLAGTAVADAGAAGKPYRLRGFTGCEALVETMKRHAAPFVREWGIEGVYYGRYHLVGTYPVVPPLDGGATGVPAAPAPAPAPAEPAPSGKTEGVDFSGTNVQEEGVDEPDLVKTDGDRIFAIAEGALQAIDATGPEPRVVGRLPIESGWSQELFLRGDTVIVLVSGAAPLRATTDDPDDAGWESTPQTSELLQVDVSDPRAMKVVARLRIEGWTVSARRVGASVRVVVSSDPAGLDVYYPATEADGPEALARNRASLAASTVENWIPLYELQDASGTTSGPAVDCDDVKRPRAFSGLGMLSVLTIDLDRGLEPVDVDAVTTDGEVVYASTRSLYVATTRWLDPTTTTEPDDVPGGLKTVVHAFDVSDPEETTYRASGAVRGFLTSQWSMSEHDGYLRVASTDAPWWWGWAPELETQSYVTVLAGRDGVLERVGRVGGIGEGEWIEAVRFVGDTGYVVTFRQTDPLYTIDLSDPTAPRVVGELELLGYSAYLHPIGDGLLLGVGQDADGEGVILGTQVSVFDVSDPARPALLDRLTLGSTWSEVEWDHHAFLFWPRTGLAVLPVLAWWYDEDGDDHGFSGAVGVHADASGVERVGTIVHPPARRDPWQGAIRRSLVIGDTLYTVSEHGLAASELDTLERRSWTPF